MKITASTRRHFLKTAATAVTAFQILPRRLLGGPGFVPPSETINIALVGAGGRGMQNANFVLAFPDVQIIAVADPAEHFSLEDTYYKGSGGRRAAQALVGEHQPADKAHLPCGGYEDFRVMLEREPAIDAVLCSTPDHLHALVSVMAMRAGKHVYCEKPLTHNIREARLVAQVARETGVATQMGNHGHSKIGIRETVEHLRAGTIGEVREILVWSTAKRINTTLSGRPTDIRPVPDGLNWDLWLGPRDPRPFHPAYHPCGWRDFWAFGSAGIGDMGCHDMDAATWAYDLASPTSVEAFGAGAMNDEIGPYGSVIHYDFPASGGRPALRLTWMDGGLRPPAREILEGFPLPPRGGLFLGEKGAIECDGAGGAPRVFPRKLRMEITKPPAVIPRVESHHRDWINACKGGRPASSLFEYGARLTEIVQLGALALRAGHRIEWNGAALCTQRGVAGAEEIINGTYRPGWEVI